MSNLFDNDEDEFLDVGSVEIEDDSATPAQAEELTPRTNADLYGHEAVEKALLADFLSQRMPHAIVLSGAPGIGKATLAFRLARFLFSQKEDGGGLFGEAAPPTSLYVSPNDPVFRRVASGGHADLLVVEREFDEKKGRLKNDISVESVRRIHPFLRMTAAESGWRVVIVDGAECLNTASQNALLKILEEPPEKTVLILTTSQPGAFLPTIRSRCRMVPMEVLNDKFMGTLLDRLAPGAEKATLLRFAQGSIGKALQFHAEGGAALHKQITDILSAPDLVKVHDLAEKIGRPGTERAYEIACEILIDHCARRARAFDPAAFAAWEKITQLVDQADRYTLDKRLVILGAFLALQRPEFQGLSL